MQGWPTRGSRAACGSLPSFMRLFLHSLFLLPAAYSSVILLRLATQQRALSRNNHLVERITTRRVTRGGAHFRGFAPGQHRFEVRRNIAAVATLCPLLPALATNPRPPAPIAMSLATELTGRYRPTTNLAKKKYVYQKTINKRCGG